VKHPDPSWSQSRVLWYWIDARHEIYRARLRGEPPPWTDDSILREYRFTNVFRRLDRVTQEALVELHGAWSEADRLFRAVAFRVFNWPPTYRVLKTANLLCDWHEDRANRLLELRQGAGEKIVTGAWMVSGAAAPGRPIYEGYTKALSLLAPQVATMAAQIRRKRSTEFAYVMLQRLPGVGRFVGWQIVLDLMYTPMLSEATDADSFLYVGPGAVRGLLRLDGVEIPKGDAGLAPKYPGGQVAAIARIQKLQRESERRVWRHQVPRLTIHDIEHAVCESDKYARALRGEGRPRSRYSPDARSLPRPI